ncbi:MAG TPA: hypothetical protein VFB59_03740 [Candidatus Saccharimonadales bacterium]|nr:hypothetical protein [Candidatus Saccharimonadales bacterium]
MALNLQVPVERFARRNPQTVGLFTKVIEGGGHIALGFSNVSYFVAEVLDLPTSGEPDDSDLVAPNNEFERIAGLMGVNIAFNKRLSVQTADGLDLHFKGDELKAMADTSIQLIRPRTMIRAGKHRYNTAVSPTVVGARTIYETNEGLVPVGHIGEWLLMYSISQRPHPKGDAQKVAMLRQGCDMLDPYLVLRGTELGADDRVWQFAAHAGHIANTHVLAA